MIGKFECQCFYYDPQEGSETCECGHELDEHDKYGDCKVEMDVNYYESLD